MSLTARIWIEFVTLALMVVGAINWGLVGAVGFNAVAWLAAHTHAVIEPLIYVLVGVAALVHVFSRDYYLPFLGKAAYPCGSLQSKTPTNADLEVVIQVEPNVNVIFWAAEPSTDKAVIDNPWTAYSEYENTGVTKSDAAGRAVLRVRSPASYKVPTGKTLQPHIHYRTCSMKGMLGRVEKVWVRSA